MLALQGADLIVLPTNWPTGSEPTAYLVANYRALENHVYYATANRIGVEREFRFIGGSRFCHPDGRTERSTRTFTSLKEAGDDAAVHGYGAWKSDERRDVESQL